MKNGQGLVEFALILVLVAIVVIVALALVGPSVGNVFSQILVEVQPDEFDDIPSRVVSLTFVGGKLLESDSELLAGSIEVYNVPKVIHVGTGIQVRAIITPSEPIVTVKLGSTTGEDSAYILSMQDSIEIYPRMSAALYGSAFAIEPEGHQERRTEIGIPAEWNWIVTPEEAGDDFPLTLEVSVPVDTVSNIGQDRSSLQALETYEFPVQVLTSGGLSRVQGDLLDIIVKVLGIGVVGSLLIWLFRLSRRVIRHLRSRRSQLDQIEESQAKSDHTSPHPFE